MGANLVERNILYLMIPSDIVIILVFLLIIGIVSMVIVALFTRVPFVPTPRIIADKMIDLARFSGSERVYDLGAGTGSILHRLKIRYPDVSAIGIELSPIVWFVGWCKSRKKGIHFRLQNAFKEDLRTADGIFLYMMPSMMRALEAKFNAELRPGTVVVSHAFAFPGREATETVLVMNGQKKVHLRRYVW